jgi:hypothetical protein
LLTQYAFLELARPWRARAAALRADRVDGDHDYIQQGESRSIMFPPVPIVYAYVVSRIIRSGWIADDVGLRVGRAGA